MIHPRVCTIRAARERKIWKEVEEEDLWSQSSHDTTA
jgi:hypothetical protein